MSQKTLTGSGQNRHAVGYPSDALGYTDSKTAGVDAGAKPSRFVDRNNVNPTSRLFEAGRAARQADGVAGRGCWKKRKPPCNGTDKGRNITRLRKQADFQRVVRYDRAGRTDEGGNRK